MYKISRKFKIFRENNVINSKRSGGNKVMTHKSFRENKVTTSESGRPEKGAAHVSMKVR